MFVINKSTFQLFKEIYNYELDHKEKINSRITVPIAIITLLVGLAVYYFQGFKNIKLDVFGVSFFIIYALYITSLVIAIVLTFRAYYNYEYKYLPSPEKLDEYVGEISKYYDDNYEAHFKDKGDKQSLIDNRITQKLYIYYKECATQNIEMNKRKLTYLRYVGYTLIIATILAIISIVPYHLSFQKENVTKVEIKKFQGTFEEKNKTNGGTKDMEQQTNENHQNNQSNNSTPPPEPPAPEVRIIQEGFDIGDLVGNEKS